MRDQVANLMDLITLSLLCEISDEKLFNRNTVGAQGMSAIRYLNRKPGAGYYCPVRTDAKLVNVLLSIFK